jgi:FtsZ-binding cell division protein ZapB
MNKLNKYIHIDNTGKKVERVLSIINEEDIAFNPTGLTYILINDYVDPPELISSLSKNYAMYDKVNKQFKWVQIQYQNTATEELLEIENLKTTNMILQNELQSAQENINTLTEALADMIGGAI